MCMIGFRCIQIGSRDTIASKFWMRTKAVMVQRRDDVSWSVRRLLGGGPPNPPL